MEENKYWPWLMKKRLSTETLGNVSVFVSKSQLCFNPLCRRHLLFSPISFTIIFSWKWFQITWWWSGFVQIHWIKQKLDPFKCFSRLSIEEEKKEQRILIVGTVRIWWRRHVKKDDSGQWTLSVSVCFLCFNFLVMGERARWSVSSWCLSLTVRPRTSGSDCCLFRAHLVY